MVLISIRREYNCSSYSSDKKFDYIYDSKQSIYI